MKRSARINRIQPSPTLAITAKAKALKAAGEDVISFGVGEPDFPTPKPIVEAAKKALDEGKTTYTPAAGLKVLREKIALDYKRRGRDVSWDEVLVSVGGKHALFNATQVVFDADDKVIIPAPYWVSYPAQVKLSGADPIFIQTDLDTDFKPSVAQIKTFLEDPKVKGLILCSPSNPTGSVFSESELKAIGDALADRPDVIVFFDAMYDRLFFEGEIAPDFVAVNPHLASQTLTFNGFSKTYAMTGWRLGYTVGPKDVIADMAKLQSQSTSNPTTFAQYGGLEALDLDDDVIANMRGVFKGRRDLIVSLLNGIQGVNCATPGGAFYVFPDFSAFIGNSKIADDLAFAGFLLEEVGVALVPGSAFGSPGYARMSYATSEDLIKDGVSRIAIALEKLRPLI